MKDKIFGILQRIGRSFMLPIALLPAAGLLLGIGGSFTNPTMISAYHLESILGSGTLLYCFFHIMCEAGNIVFANLPIIFAMGIAIGMAKKEKEVAALAAAISFFIMHASINALIDLNGGVEAMMSGATANVCGITSLQMGVFGGIIVGCGVSVLHNKYYNIELPQALSFFGGSRFVPIISSLVYLLVGIAMYFIWPPVQIGINSLSKIILASGYLGTLIYGIIERALIPFGLHHVFYLPIWQTSLGGTMEVGGKIVDGAQDIFFAQLGNPDVKHFSVEATRFMSGKFPFMIFGLPGAALAMYRAAKPEKRSVVKGLLVSAALTSILTGITEPIEFTFLFVAPFLYYIHCFLAGLSYMLMHILDVGVGMTFSGGFIDLFLFGIMQGNDKTNWIYVIAVGAVYFVVYYFLFYFIIKKWNLMTPGRDDSEEVKLYTKADVLAKNEKEKAVADDMISEQICNGLGGKKNISDVDCCITRLRCSVFKPELVDQEMLKNTGASGVICKGAGVQIIYGPKVPNIKVALEEYLLTAPDVEYSGAKAENNEGNIVTEENAPKINKNIVMLVKEGTVKAGEAIMTIKHPTKEDTTAVASGDDKKTVSSNTDVDETEDNKKENISNSNNGIFTFTHIIKDEVGIHARPAGGLVKLIKSLKCQVAITLGEKTTFAASVFELLRLGATQNSELQITCSGEEAEQGMQTLKKYLEENL